ncbi:MAG: hypothetical protein Q4B28_02995 [bacterium]|nr:hypothetical protein [bacterium]
MENAKTLEEKKELAIVFEKMQLLAQAHEAEKAELTKQVKAALGNLESTIIVSQAYDTADANKLEKKSDFDQKIDRTHKEARWARKKIFEQLASKDADMKLKLSFQEKKIMRQFAGVVNDIENWTRAEKKDENLTFTPSVEKVILDYIHSNPEQAARNTDEQWIDMLKAAGLVIKQENRVERRFGARGTTYLKEFAQYYAESFNFDQTQGYTAGKNIRKYFDMVRQSGGFEGMLATYWDAAESSREAFKDKDRAKRLSKRLEKADLKTDSDVLNLFVDFNLDGTVAHGDSGFKSGLQIHSLYERLAGNDEAEQAKIIDNILAATNKANGLEGDAAITRDTAKSLEQLDKIQTLLKNPPVDVRYILQYGAEATDKFIAEHKDKVQLAKTPAEEKAFNEAVNKQVNKVQEDIKKEKQKAQEANDQQALQVLNELEKLPKEKLRLGLAQVLEGQVMTMKQSGMGIGVNIPLQKVLKGLSFNLGASMDKNGKPNLGINLARNGSVDLSENGRFKAFGGANAGTTLATIPVLGATAGLGYTFENKKMDQSLTNRSEKTVSIGGHVIWSPVLFGRGGSIGIDRDLNKGRLEQEKNILNSISTMTADLLTKGAVDGKFKADPAVIEAALKERLGKTKKEDMDQAVKNLTMALKMYEGAEINAATTQLISEELAKAYSLAWSNLQVQKLDQKGWYISGGGLSVTFYAGVIPVVGILKFANHRFAGTADDLSSLEQVKRVMKSDEYNKELEG